MRGREKMVVTTRRIKGQGETGNCVYKEGRGGGEGGRERGRGRREREMDGGSH